MKRRLSQYLTYLREISLKNLSPEEREILMKDLLIQISFFQHERLIHLLVTLSFALLTVAAVITTIFVQSFPVLILAGLFFILLVPYIMHYYFLENGVQELYTFYDALK